MARRRGDGPPGLIDRVRWGNLGRLAAVLAAGLLIAFGPGSCGGGDAKQVAQPRGLLPDSSAAEDQYGAAGPKAEAPAVDVPASDPPEHRERTHKKKRRKGTTKGSLAKQPAPATRPARRAP